MDHQLQIGAGDQVLATVAIDAAGEPARPSAATYRIVDLKRAEDDADRIIAQGSATIDAATAELGEAAGRGTADAARLRLTAPASGFDVGGRYLIRDRTYREQLVLAGIDGDTLRCVSPLTFRYAAGATIVGLAVRATYPGAAAAAPDDDAIHAVDWAFTSLRPTRELIRFARLGRVRYGSVEGVQGIDQGLGSFVGERRQLAAALAQANREIAAELAVAGEPQLELGEVGDLAAEYLALALIYASIPAQAERAKWARGRADYFLENVKRGDKPRGVSAIDPIHDTAHTPTRRGLFRTSG